MWRALFEAPRDSLFHENIPRSYELISIVSFNKLSFWLVGGTVLRGWEETAARQR